MDIQTLTWSTRSLSKREWFRSKTDMKKREVELKKLYAKRPFEQFSIINKHSVEIYANKDSILEVLNTYAENI